MMPASIDFEFQQIGAAIPDFSNDARSIHFNPRSRPSQRVHQSPQVSLPGTCLKIKIVLPIPFHRSGLSTILHRDGARLRESALSPQANHQAAHHKINANMFHSRRCSLEFVCHPA
jgi:hypothetical protein